MGREIDGSRIDAVLAGAVDRGAVPHVAAIAADGTACSTRAAPVCASRGSPTTR